MVMCASGTRPARIEAERRPTQTVRILTSQMHKLLMDSSLGRCPAEGYSMADRGKDNIYVKCDSLFKMQQER